jgi:hypothetical protein
MKRLWFNSGGILRDSIGLAFCDYCPCDEPPSSSGSSSVPVSSSEGCTSSTCVEVACCPGVLIPTTLTAVITGGSCAGTYTLEYGFGGGDGWRVLDGPPDISLSCSGTPSIWYLEVEFDAQEPTTVSCDPLELFADFTGFGGTCGDFTITITG